jgi:hypothetical protein
MQTATQIGRVGELIACAAIEHLGWACIVCPSDGYDLVAMHQNNVLRIQVKATSKFDTRMKYYFNTGTGAKKKSRLNTQKIEILALVALNQRLVYFKPIVNDMPFSMRLPQTDFSMEQERMSWNSSINSIFGDSNAAG